LCTQVHEEKNLALTGGKDGHLILYDLDSESIVVDIKAHQKPVLDISFVNNATQENEFGVASIGEDGKFLVHKVNTVTKKSELVYENSQGKSKPVSLCVHPLGWLALIAYEDGLFVYFDLNEVNFIQSNTK
jgi:WD40 repeat protein